jgi:hypothetical protein
VAPVWALSNDVDPSIEEIKFRFGEHKKTHPKRLNLKHTLKRTMKPTQQKRNFGWRVCLEQQNQEEQSEQNPLWSEFPPLKLALIEP